MRNYQVEFGSPALPAVLLIHGLAKTTGPTSRRTWRQPSLMGVHWDHRSPPTRIAVGGTNVPGIAGFGISDLDLTVDGRNWVSALQSLGCTVGTFDRDNRGFEAGAAECLEAFDRFLDDTATQFGPTPPPVALIGHSQGGLMIRQLLRVRGTVGRVRLVVTLCSPHLGSNLGAAVPTFATTWLDRLFPDPNDPVKNGIRELIRTQLQPLTNELQDSAQQELRPGSDVLRALAAGERALPGVTYLSIGGTSPTFARLFTWVTAVTAARGQIPRATARPVEIAGVSPWLDRFTELALEFRPATGDGLVTNLSAVLPIPGAAHVALPVNHAEVLWDTPAQTIVRRALSQVSPLAALSITPATATVPGGRSQRFTISGIDPVDWTANPGTIDANGNYAAPTNIRSETRGAVVATARDGSRRTARATVVLTPNIAQKQPFAGVPVAGFATTRLAGR